MQREIEFRGKRKDDNKWVYGNLIEFPAISFICPKPEEDNAGQFELIQIIPETIGQYTGSKDLNGDKIFGKDIVEYERRYYEIAYIDEDCFFMGARHGYSIQGALFSHTNLAGNMIDDPELVDK